MTDTKQAREALIRMAWHAGRAPGVNELGRSLISHERAEIDAIFDSLTLLESLLPDVRVVAKFGYLAAGEASDPQTVRGAANRLLAFLDGEKAGSRG